MERSALSNFIQNHLVLQLYQCALENGDAQDDQDGELVETMEDLKLHHGNLEEEKFEDIG